MESVIERSQAPPVYPFDAIVGMEAAKEALLLLAVEPRLNGVLIAGPAGSGKTILARSMRSLIASAGAGCFVELPLQVTNESLLGSLDLETTIKRGVPVFSMGLLGRADRGFLFIDHVDRIDLATAAQIAQALNHGIVAIEREGRSLRSPSRFRLVATYAPDDGEVCTPFRDAAGMHVVENGYLSAADHLTMLRRVEAFNLDPEAFMKSCADATARLAQRVKAARKRLSYIHPTPADLRFLSSIALELGVDGHRAECFCWRLIRARAALMGRTEIVDGDLEAAVRLVLEPRSRARSTPSPASESSRRGGGDQASNPPPRADADTLDCPPPPGALLHPNPRDGRTGGRGRSRQGHAPNIERGRYVGALAGPMPGGKVALDATLRAAAPFQFIRRRGDSGAGSAISIAPEDLRFKLFKRRSGILIVFAVDASGSMAMNRISLAKGALLRLLRQAYLHRDKVSLIAFQGFRGEVLLPPSRSVDRARRAVQGLKVGEGTPVAAGLEAAMKVIRLDRNVGCRHVLLVLFTDGGANVPLVPGNDVWSEIGALAGRLWREGAASVVIDTTSQHRSTGRGERLAALLGGRHLSLPGADREMLHGILAGMAGGLREQP